LATTKFTERVNSGSTSTSGTFTLPKRTFKSGIKSEKLKTPKKTVSIARTTY
jgi:hypothetical protein